ncbi:hypothetical protein D3C87_189510 [compost metagenome]
MTLMRNMNLFMALALASAIVASSSSAIAAPAKSPNYTEYLTIDEVPDKPKAREPDNYDLIGDFKDPLPFQWAQTLKKIAINLLKWNLHEEKLPLPEEKYIRKLHFGRWINDPADNTCMNTRARVLVRDSQVPVSFKGTKKCVVEEGSWDDPYTGEVLTSSRQIQIDHMVPLKNAYVSGAWKWDYKTRCLFANFMEYPGHLVSSEAKQNMSKGDRSPDGYMPPNITYRCEYLKHWLAVKMLWRLSLTMDEAQAIHDTVNSLKCNPADFRFDVEEMKKTRQFIKDNIDFCVQK